MLYNYNYIIYIIIQENKSAIYYYVIHQAYRLKSIHNDNLASTKCNKQLKQVI